MHENRVRIIDLSLPIDEKAKEPFPVKIKKLDHSRVEVIIPAIRRLLNPL